MEKTLQKTGYMEKISFLPLLFQVIVVKNTFILYFEDDLNKCYYLFSINLLFRLKTGAYQQSAFYLYYF